MRKFPWFVFFIALYPIAALYSSNITEVNVVNLIRPVLFYLAFTSVIWGVLRVVLKDSIRAGFITTLIIILFSSYGIIYNLIRGVEPGGIILGRHRILAPVSFLIFGSMIWWVIIQNREKLRSLVFYGNIISLVLLLMPISQMVLHADKIKLPPKQTINLPSVNHSANETTPPDVYYFLLDSYSREDYIKQYLKYDNSPFLNEIREMGFFVADCSLSNYSATRLSLASSLNMDYLDKLSNNIVPENKDETILDSYILNSKVVEKFRENGYQIVAFETGYPFTDLVNADIHFSVISKPYFAPYLTAFEVLAVENTIVSALKGNQDFARALGIGFEFSDKFQRQKFILSKIPSIPSIPGPKFVFIHLVTTHRPYIFNPDGSPIIDKNYYLYEGFPASTEFLIDGYQRVLQYTNSELMPVLKSIITESKQQPVIILQGDHGVLAPGRNSILLSIYGLSNANLLSSDLSPVNIFPIVLNDVFKSEIPLHTNQYASSNINKDPFLFTTLDASAPCIIQ